MKWNKRTKQGILNLNEGGVNGHRTWKHRHFYGPFQVVGHEWALDPHDFQYYQRKVYGQKCIHCGKIESEP